MESAIYRHNLHWDKPYQDLFRREIVDTLLDRISLRQIEVVKGIRRAGKTTVCKLLINEIIKTNDPLTCLYVNLDDPYFSEFYSDSKHLFKLLEITQKLTGKKVEYFFLDEVQNVVGWEKFVKTIYDNENVKKIYITGSNSSLLDGEYAKLLSGRYLSSVIYPPSLKEVYHFFGLNDRLDIVKNKAYALKLIDDAMQYGTFFEVLKEIQFKREIILNYYDTIIYKDCIANHNIRDSKGFKELAHFVVSNTSNLYSYHSIAKALGSNENSTKKYISYLQDAYICNEIKQFSFSLKEQIKTKRKTYITDNSFLAQTSFRFSKDSGKLLENLVYTELLKAGYEIYFYHKEFECDFICKKENKLYAFQVCYELNRHNQERELNGLKKLPFEPIEKRVITYNQDEVIDGIDIVSIVGGIRF